MEYFVILLIVVIIYLLYLLNQKKNKLINTATIINNREEKTIRVIIDELEDQFFALNKFNIIKYANPSELIRFGSSLFDNIISSLKGITAQAIKASVIVTIGAKIKITLFALAGIIISLNIYFIASAIV